MDRCPCRSPAPSSTLGAAKAARHPPKSAWAFAAVCAVFGPALLGACSVERPTDSPDRDVYRLFPEDVVQVGPMYVRAAGFSGDLAAVEGFGGAPRVLADHRDALTTLELALLVEEGTATMHRIEFRGGIFDSAFAAGSQTQFSRETPDGDWSDLRPVACSGPSLGMWEEDVLVRSVDLTVTEEDDDHLRYDWELVSSRYATPDVDQVSWGSVILAPLAELPGQGAD